VIREEGTSGPLVDTLIFILAFDDILAILAGSLAINLSVAVLGASQFNLVLPFVQSAYEIVGAVIIGLVFGIGLEIWCRMTMTSEERMEGTLALIIIVIGVAIVCGFSVILACMVFGAFVNNRITCKRVSSVDRFFTPIIMLFFVLVGAEMDLRFLTLNPQFLPLVVVGILYIIGRTAGKILGATGGALVTKSPPSVTKNLGFSLMTQAGVVLGLAYVFLDQTIKVGIPETGVFVLSVIGFSVLVFEIFGPLGVKFALRRGVEEEVSILEEEPCDEYKTQDGSKSLSETACSKSTGFVGQKGD